MTDGSANQRVSNWLENLDTALQRNDSAGAARLFAEQSFWRDFVAFTWNLKTMEGREEIATMLDATLTNAKPSNWRLDGDASEADGITEGWIKFETSAGRGEGHREAGVDPGSRAQR